MVHGPKQCMQTTSDDLMPALHYLTLDNGKEITFVFNLKNNISFLVVVISLLPLHFYFLLLYYFYLLFLTITYYIVAKYNINGKDQCSLMLLSLFLICRFYVLTITYCHEIQHILWEGIKFQQTQMYSIQALIADAAKVLLLST